MMGRGVAESAIRSTLATYKLKRPLLVMGRSGPKRFAELLGKLDLLTASVD